MKKRQQIPSSYAMAVLTMSLPCVIGQLEKLVPGPTSALKKPSSSGARTTGIYKDMVNWLPI